MYRRSLDRNVSQERGRPDPAVGVTEAEMIILVPISRFCSETPGLRLDYCCGCRAHYLLQYPLNVRRGNWQQLLITVVSGNVVTLQYYNLFISVVMKVF